MKWFWALSERHWLLKPVEIIGDWMEDYGLDHGYITVNIPGESEDMIES
jgi:hypothetical protein